MEELMNYEEVCFENIKHIDENGVEYWEARELMQALKYTKWSNFKLVLEKAKLACYNSNNAVEDHFADVGKMISLAKGASRTIVILL